MARVALESIGRQIETLFEGSTVAGLTDRQLLERFTARRDAAGEAAFAALVTRHGPMVLHVCRQLLVDRHHAEDAFQAVFLVLARKALSIRDPNLLGTWLYGVSIRTARTIKVRNARQRRKETDSMRRAGLVSNGQVPSADQPALAREQAEALHNEIDRLPNSFRLPVVLCYFEGLTLDEAAQRLNWPAGTVRSRLARARDKLRRGLTRRGMTLPSAALAVVLNPKSNWPRVSSPLSEATTRAAIQFTAGQAASDVVSASVAPLAKEVLRAMLMHKLKFNVPVVLLFGVVVSGAGYLTQSIAMQGEPKGPPVAAQPPRASRPDNTMQGPAPDRMIVTGRVLDPKAKPMPNAKVMVYAHSIVTGGMGPAPIGQASTDESGGFRLDSPRTSSAGHDQLGAAAFAPGYGVGWIELNPDADQPTADITLRPEQLIQGRLFDVQGRPARDVAVTVRSMGRVVRRNLGRIQEALEGPQFWWIIARDVPAWPRPATTDAEGRFTVHGVGRNLRAYLAIDDARFATQSIEVNTDDAPDPKQLTMALAPAQIITGRVTCADTLKPLPLASISVDASFSDKEGGGWSSAFKTDADGRFRANPFVGDRFSVSVLPPAGSPYLIGSKQFDWPKGAVEYPLDLVVARGVLIRGKVREADSGKPVSGALVRYDPRTMPDENPSDSGRPGSSRTSPDGSFHIALPPRPGHLSFHGTVDDYVSQDVAERLVWEGKPGGVRLYAHALAFLDLKPGSDDREVDVVLRRGVTARGQVVKPDGSLVQDAWMFSRILLPRIAAPWRRWSALFDHHGAVRDGQFQLHALDPGTEVPVYFLEPKTKLGATVIFSGKKAAGGPVTVRLEPCGTAKARLVDPAGKPIQNFGSPRLIMMVVTPGALSSRANEKQGLLLADEDHLHRIDPINYENRLVSDVQGRVTFSALIPGATYRIVDRTAARNPTGPELRKEFAVKPGETLDLGDILIEKPVPLR